MISRRGAIERFRGNAHLRTVAHFVALTVFVTVTAALAHAETPIPPAPTAWVTDTASVLSTQTVADVDATLRAFERKTGHQILVYVAPTTGGAPLEDWTVRTFARWKVGRKGIDDGLAIFLFPRDRTVRIEVGYGFEGTIPDALAARVVRETIVPQMRAGFPDRAVTLGVDRILRLARGESAGTSSANAPAAGPTGGDRPQPLTPIELVLIGFAIVGFLIFAIRSPMTALFLLVNMFGGRGGMSSEGGFSGGGGRSGGGGASGRW